MEDIEILSLLEQGDERALKEVMMKNQKGLFFLARKGFPFDEPMIEDFFLETIIVFYQNVRAGDFSYKGPNCIRAFLRRVFQNKLINELDKKNNRRRLEPDVIKSSQSWYLNKNADEETLRSEEVQAVRAAMAELSPRCQEVLTLFYVEGMSLKEIAMQMEMKNADTAKSTKHQCYQKLTKIVKDKRQRGEL